MKRTIDEERARQLAVEARCDPRTIKKVLRGEVVRGSVAERARIALVKAGYLSDTEARQGQGVTSGN